MSYQDNIKLWIIFKTTDVIKASYWMQFDMDHHVVPSWTKMFTPWTWKTALSHLSTKSPLQFQTGNRRRPRWWHVEYRAAISDATWTVPDYIIHSNDFILRPTLLNPTKDETGDSGCDIAIERGKEAIDGDGFNIIKCNAAFSYWWSVRIFLQSRDTE